MPNAMKWHQEFSQELIQRACQRAARQEFTSDWNVVDGWHMESNRVVGSAHRNYIRLMSRPSPSMQFPRVQFLCDQYGAAICSMLPA